MIKSLKNKLADKEISIGSWITIGHPSVVEIMSTAGFDWLAIDIEHSSINIEKIRDLIITIKSCDIAALVRVGKNDDLIIKSVLDAGADGIIVPMVCSKEDAEKAVSNVYYPPRGKRGVGLSRAQGYGIAFDKYKKWLQSEVVIIAQIEHKYGVKNLEDIISVEGIDSIIIGPYDLSASLGIPGELNNPLLVDSINEIEKCCNKNDFPLGFHVIQTDHSLVNQKIQNNYKFIGFSLDFYFLGDMAPFQMQKIK